jgi:hypothetical protein
MKAAMMPRFSVLWCPDTLMLDLTADECLGQAEAIIPLSQSKFPIAKSPHDPGQVNPPVGQLPGTLPGIPLLFQDQSDVGQVKYPFQISDYPLSCSSGGVRLC